MTIEDKIQTLLNQAAPLRPLEEDDPKKARLAAIVDEINALRAEQAELNMAVLDDEFQSIVQSTEPVKRGPGRPPKIQTEAVNS